MQTIPAHLDPEEGTFVQNVSGNEIGTMEEGRFRSRLLYSAALRSKKKWDSTSRS